MDDLKKKEHVEKEISAGGIVIRRKNSEIFFAVMLDSYQKWTFPKGHVEKGETLEETAVRETFEELGIDKLTVLKYLGKIDIWFRDKFTKKGMLIHKDIHYFLFEAEPNSKLSSDPKQHSYDAKWVSKKDILEVSDYSDMVPIVKKALEYVKEFF